MIRAAISLRVRKEETVENKKNHTTARTPKTALLQAVLRETYSSSYGRAVLAQAESYPGYFGFKGMIPDYTALSDWLC